MKKFAFVALTLLLAASVAMAGVIPQFKAGDISFLLFDKDAVSPLQAAAVKVLDSGSGDVVAEAVSDDLGQAVLALDAGRYLLNVSDLNLAVFDVGADGLSLCRIYMPDAALLAGGQEAKDRDDRGGAYNSGSAVAGESGLGSWVVPAGIVAGAAILVGGAWAIIDHQQPSKTIGRHEEPAPVPEQPHRQQPTPKPTPTPVPPVHPSAT